MAGYVYKGAKKNEPTIAKRGNHMQKYRDGRKYAPCGTDSGYRRHLRQKEETCDACKDAHNRSAAKLRGGSTTGKRKRVAECGTYGGVAAHRHKRERPCEACHEAERQYARKRRANRKATGLMANGRKPVIKHGTISGYRQECYYNIPRCPECLKANREYKRACRLAGRD